METGVRVSVTLEDGTMATSKYAIGQWVKYEEGIARVCAVAWETNEPILCHPCDHWNGQWFEPGFRYSLRSLDDFVDSDEVEESSICRAVPPRNTVVLEQKRQQNLEKKRLINIVKHAVQECGGMLPRGFITWRQSEA